MQGYKFCHNIIHEGNQPIMPTHSNLDHAYLTNIKLLMHENKNKK